MAVSSGPPHFWVMISQKWSLLKYIKAKLMGEKENTRQRINNSIKNNCFDFEIIKESCLQ